MNQSRMIAQRELLILFVKGFMQFKFKYRKLSYRCKTQYNYIVNYHIDYFFFYNIIKSFHFTKSKLVFCLSIIQVLGGAIGERCIGK